MAGSPDILEVLLNWPAYRVIAKGEKAQAYANLLCDTELTFDAYCVECGKEATFRRWIDADAKRARQLAAHLSYEQQKAPFLQTIRASCTRRGHTYVYFFGSYNGGIAKLGQSPSLADIAKPELKRFSGVLEPVDVEELGRASMLYTNGVGIGAFVYLRRIFERLLDRHHADLRAGGDAVKDFEKLAVDQRVLALKAVLPAEVVANRRIYAILSAGIHELDEQTCLKYCALLQTVIEEILEEDIATRRKTAAKRDLRNAIAKIKLK